MVYNRQPPAAGSLCFLITALFLMGIAPLRAQTDNYSFELRFVQRLTWVGDDYAMRYEVIIEKEEEGRYTRVLREFTEAFFIEVSLSPGKYRYRVIPHDFLDQPIPVTEWMNFIVQRGVTQEQVDRMIQGEQKNIPGDPNGITSPFINTEEQENNRGAPGEAEKIVEYTNRFDIYLGAAWIPLLYIIGEDRSLGENPLLGAGLRLGIVSAKQGFLMPGMELIASWRTYGKYPGQSAHSWAFDFNILAQTRFFGGGMALNFRLGAGVFLWSEISAISATGRYSVHANAGASLLFLFHKNFYIEPIGMDYSQSFTEGFLGFLHLRMGLGFRF